jgi:hypothetical protein
MMRCLLVLFLGISFISSFSYAADYKSVPETINHYKDQIVTVKDLDEDARQFFIESYKGKEPGIIRADFNGDGEEDVALLTKGALLFFICKERCKEIKNQNYGGFAGFQYIISIQKGELVEEFGGFDNQPPTPSVRLKNIAVHLIFFGKASIAYYWDSKINNFSDITTGD